MNEGGDIPIRYNPEGHQPGALPIDVPEEIPNPAVPKEKPVQPTPEPKPQDPRHEPEEPAEPAQPEKVPA